MASNNSINNQALNGFTASGGTVNIAADALNSSVNVGTGNAVKTVTIGDLTNPTSSTVIRYGDTLTMQGGSTSTVQISADNFDTTMFIGTGAAVKALSIGSGNTTSSTNINCGTGGMLIGTGANSHSVTLGSTSGTSATILQAGSGGVSVTGFTEGALVTSNVGVISTVTGTPGFVLTANTAGSAPSFQATSTPPLAITSVVFADSPYTVLAADQFLAVNSTGGAITILLANAPSTGRVVYIKDVAATADTNNITVTTVGGAVLIDGSTSFVMNSEYESISTVFDGSAYFIF